MQFDGDLAEIRFGAGLSPLVRPPVSAEAMLSRLQGADEMALRFPLSGFDEAFARAKEFRRLRRDRKRQEGGQGYEAADKAFKAYRRGHNAARFRWHGQRLLRHVFTRDAFRERLVLFWADHFTAQGKNGALRILAAPYAESVIRPLVAGRFEDMLIAAATSPLMLHYLDQNRSAGPGSRAAKRRKRLSGLNENLAREVLELHTLGVDGPYGQADVRQLAELFTGLTAAQDKGFVFRPGMAEPGAETVLGQTYGGGKPELGQVLSVLRDLARHPATAQHLAWKLAVHFTSDQPEPGLVSHLAARYQDSGGDLMQVYSALLEHPAAWRPDLQNVKPPFDYVASACRALAVPEARFSALKPGQLNRLLLAPLTPMGQRWEFSGGPDGWPEEDTSWITPQALAARLRWAMAAPRRLAQPLPDPRVFATAALGRFANERVRFAARAAETQSEAVGLILTSPAFQRR
ncbi:DUF1800 domain-containing protein [Leisingera sp. HS039]|uniref:DUF1800 domain-containing protein n=1 Tax=unclassified Leisingera TaxID=2614906 RepID=UPI001070A390|nr:MULTISPECIES: DUF1800 domain-containing protein [unclassified Leisingera]MBQ4824912.1 DUF1800 domain-containing protein [Leisingera sp. HS039]QBR36995.1 DUF1800 domain-containing protein [Leisingera sp. NJS201]